jgi:hypothetical protein
MVRRNGWGALTMIAADFCFPYFAKSQVATKPIHFQSTNFSLAISLLRAAVHRLLDQHTPFDAI